MKKFLKTPHLLDIEQVLKASDSSVDGLKNEEVKKRLDTFGYNELPESKPISPLKILLKQFRNSLVFILIVASGISWFVGQIIDSWVIISAILLDVSIGFSQEYKAQKAVLALKKIIVITVKVLRDGEITILPARELVPGDVFILEEGDSIPADGRIIQSNNFRTVEASLTGESLPISKSEKVFTENVPLADQDNMAWRGTYVAGGYARVLVTGTGSETVIGDISKTLDTITEARTNFSKKTNTLAKQMSLVALVSATLIFITGYFFRGFEFNDVLLTSIAALVAAIPEGLSVVFSIVLAIGAKRMAKRNAIIREFSATETLGTISTILTDKTGTLTQNSLTVRNILIPEEDEITLTGEGWFPAGNFMQGESILSDIDHRTNLQKLLQIAAVSNNSSIQHLPDSNSYQLVGDPTEGALLVMSRKGGFHSDNLSGEKLDDLPFDSTLKLRATLTQVEQHSELFVTGAPEKILDRCSHIISSGGDVKLDSIERAKIEKKILEWSGKALRVIALAYKKTSCNKINENEIDELVFAGIVGMIDPPRKDVKNSVEKCRRAGIRVIMVTGDHVNTAVAIAKATGIIPEINRTEVVALTEQQLLELEEDEFDQAINEVSVFARLTPKMKMKIASRLQKMGNLIAMTGDGVNDAPALKLADVGIAMGISGTDTAREASDVVLADDNFATIVNAIEEGRIVFTNARQTSFFLITTNIAESITLLLAIAIGLPLPLTATQLLWLNLVTDGITDVALATEPGHGELMDTKPMSKNEKIVNKDILPHLFINVILMTLLSLGAFLFYVEVSVEKARTAAFVVMGFTQLFNVYNMRSITISILKIGFFSNRLINMAVGVSAILLVLITEIPQLATIFRFKPLSVLDFIIMFALSSSVFWAVEIYKSFAQKNKKRKK